MIKNLLINLKVLAALQPHVRLDTTETLFRIHVASAWVPIFVKRWWAQQNRVTDMARVQTLYADAIHHVNHQHPQSERIQKYVMGSKKGLENLKSTYQNDPTVMALIDVILDTVGDISRAEDIYLEDTNSP